FFQAEDGIRDPLVTGVQTCALPICWDSFSWAALSKDASAIPKWVRSQTASEVRIALLLNGVSPVLVTWRAPNITARENCPRAARSEERRVGKERRTGWQTEE